MRISVDRYKLLRHTAIVGTKLVIRISMWTILIGTIVAIAIGTAAITAAILMKGNI
jgi:hypothetical protein